ncbi:MAG: hypothetical protein ACI89D_000641 [Bermanella sp.]|jgi:uncharacterized protein (TIGR02099 family)
MTRMLNNAAQWLYRWSWGAAIVLLVILALYASLGRYYIQYLPQYGQNLSQLVHDNSGIDMQMTGLNGEWSGLSPVVSLQTLELSHQGQIVAKLTAVRGKLGVVLGLLSHQGIDLVELRARRLELHLRQSQQGDWLFAGNFLKGNDEGSFDLASLLLGIREANLRELSLTLHYFNGEEAQLWGHKLRFSGDSRFRRLKATLGIAESSPTRLIAELSGDPRSDDFQLNAYVRLEDSSFKSVAPLFGAYETLADIDGRGEFWLSSDGQRRMQWRGRAEVPEMALGSLWSSEQRITEANLVMGGGYDGAELRSWFGELDFYWQDQYVDWSGLQLSVHTDVGSALRLVLPNFDIGLMQARLLNSKALPLPVEDILTKMAPQGVLRNLLVSFPLDKPSDFHAAADVASVVLESVNNVPGVRGLNGYIELGAQHGELSITSADIQLALPSVYEQALRLQDVTTRLQWSIADERLQLRSSQIHAFDGDSVIAGLLGLDIALSPQAEVASSISLLVGLRDGEVGQRDQYLPMAISEGLRTWLDKSVLKGQVPQAAFLLHGALRDGEQKTIQLALDASGVALDYHPDWPSLNRANAKLILDGGNVSVTSDSAYIYDDVALRDLQVEISAPENTVILTVAAKANSSLDSALRLVRESALRGQVGASFDDWRGDGEVQAVIDLHIPLGEDADPIARVETHIKGRELVLKNLNLNIMDVTGSLLFDSAQGLSAPGIRAKLFGRPVLAKVAQSYGSPVQLNVTGRIDVADVRNWLNQPLLGFARGEADVNIDISAGQDGAYFKASSDLFDLAIDLPEPLGKPSGQSRLFELGMPLSVKPLTLDMSIDRLGRLMLAFDNDNRLLGGSFALGEGSIPPPLDGFRVVGQMEETRLDDWIAVLDRYSVLAAHQRARQGLKEEAPLAIVVEDFSIQRLQGLGRTWQDVEIDADNGAGKSTWQVAMRSRRLEGTLRLAPDAPMNIDLQRFNLPALPALDIVGDISGAGLEAPAPASTRESVLAGLAPAQFPAVDFSVANLSIADAPLGNIVFSLRPTQGGADITGIRGKLRGLQLGASNEGMTLQWRQGAGGNNTALKGPVTVENTGDVLQAWQFERVMESRSGSADLDLRWNAAPDMIATKVLSGNMAIRFDKGRFLRGSDTASGTLRMVGLLNFANIIRRLQFNFRDVFEKGIHYDKIQGSMQLQDGVMRIPGAIAIDGPSSTFRISGSLDFNTDQTDMELLATLPVGSNLPWVAALISGLPVAVGVYIASKVFKEQVDRVSSIAYRVRGPWQNPDLQFKRLFGDAVSLESPDSEADKLGRGGAADKKSREGSRMGRGVPGK